MKACCLHYLPGFYLLASLPCAVPAQAATVSVCDDASLRAALSGGGTVTFGCDGVIQLTNTLVISQNTILDGSGHAITLSGGGVVRPFLVNGVQFTLKNLTVANGQGTNFGGGLYNNGSTRLIACTFSNNVALSVSSSFAAAFGGAVHSSGALTVDGCTFVNNRTVVANGGAGIGGAISSGYGNASGAMLISNSTFYGNSALSGGGVGITCPGFASSLNTIVNCTFAHNTNGGVTACTFGPRLTLSNTLLTSNNGPNCSGVIDGGYNLSSDSSGSFTHPFSLENIDPLLGPLANNGGPTFTLALLATSPAIDAGGTTNCMSTDQRGQPRPVGLGCDIGAFEANPAIAHPGVLQFAVATNSVTESNGSLTITVVRAGGSAGDVSVSFASSNRTATAGSDFQATNGTLMFLSGERTNTFQLLLLDDSSVEGIESVDLYLFNPTGGAVVGRVVSTVNIDDNDISISFASASYSVSEGIGTATLTLLRAGNTSSSASVTLLPVSGTANGSDYQIGGGTVTFNSGQTSATFSVTIINDTLLETSEVFNVTLSNPTAGAVLGSPSTTAVTILDDDGIQIVNSCDEPSLRLALDVGGKIRLACDGTIVLTNTIGINRNASLDAEGHVVTVSGNNSVQVFSVGGSVEFSVRNVTIANGFSTIQGGGIRNFGVLNVANCTFVSNAVLSATGPSGAGGAIHNQGTLRVSNSSFIGNRASFAGAAIASGYGFTQAGVVFVTNSTFFGNVCAAGATVSGAFAGPTLIVNSTLATNTGAGVSGATVINTIISGSSGANCSAVTDGGHNISSDNSCGFTHAFSLNNIDPKLGALGNYGGPTLTVSLLDGSPATDAANPTTAPPIDQRGSVRPYGIGFDIGAFETTLIGTNPGTFRFTAATQALSELQSELVIQVDRTGGAFGTTAVNFATSDITAIAGIDYIATNGALVFAPGEVQMSFAVRLLNDTVQEADKSLNVTLSAPTGGATLGNPQVSAVTIIDDETPTVVTVCDDASLRAALTAGRPTVKLACDGTIQLTNTLFVSQSVAIDGSEHDITISGGNVLRLFVVPSSVTLKLESLTLADGYAVGTNGNTSQPGGPGDGGAIYNDGGKIQASACVFSRNQAQGGIGGPAPQFGPTGTGGAARGGAVFNGIGGNFVATNCEFHLNQARGGTAGSPGASGSGGDAAGGAIYNADGSFELVGCLILSNRVVSGRGQRFGGLSGSAAAYGGAIASGGGEAKLIRSHLLWNDSIAEYLNVAYGGALHCVGTLELTDCRLSSNRAMGGRGLGISTPSGLAGGPALGGAASIFGDVRIRGTTLDSNLALGGAEPGGGSPAGSATGGAIFNTGQTSITNSTLTGNIARSGTARPSPPLHGRAYGGAVANNGGSISLSDVTISGNEASNSGIVAVGNAFGGGIFSTNGIVGLVNSIVANSPSGSNCFGTVIDGGHNLSSDGSANFTAPGSLNNTDPLLGPLADYGGPTPTMALLNGSPAIDAAGSGSCPTTDQRGIARPFGAACDIGAFESSPPYTILGRVTGFTTPNSGMTVVAWTSVATVPPAGNYALHGLIAGNYVVTPSSSEAVFVLSNRVVDVLHDTIGVDFHSYRSNALVIERIGTGATRSIFAGEAGQTYHVEVSTGFQPWMPFSINTAASSGLFEFNDTNAAPSSLRVFRVLRP